MSVLTKNEEEYVQARFEGLTQRQSYYRAYPHSKKWKEASVDNRAYLLEKKGEILSRLQALRDVQAEKSHWTVEKLIKKFEEVHARCMQEVEFDKTGKTKDGKMANIYKFEHSGANTSLKNIGELLGYYVKKVDANVTIKKLEDLIGEDD